MADDKLLPALLEEYKTLRSEIQYRTQIQNTVLQIHATVLTALLGATLSQAYGFWPIFLIPIETSLFGVWYWAHGTSILFIGTWLGKRTEPRINAIVGVDQGPTWQIQAVRRAGQVSQKDKREESGIRREIFQRTHEAQAFDGPAILGIVVGIAILVVNALFLTSVLAGDVLSWATSVGLQRTTSAQWFVALGILLFGLYLYSGYRRQVAEARETPFRADMFGAETAGGATAGPVQSPSNV